MAGRVARFFGPEPGDGWTAGASRALTRVAGAAGIGHQISPLPIRDMQYAMRHADPRTALRYDMAKANLDRHAAHSVAAYLAGMSTG